MSYPWTRVPTEPPPLDPVQLRLVPIVDLFMGLMWSRPGGLSLRTTWVTPATLWLSSGVAVAAGLPGIGAIAYGIATAHVLSLVAGMVATAFGTGAGAVATYGIRQRHLARAGRP